MLILGSLYILCWVSLIAGVGYRVQQWGGKWDGTVGVANSCNWCCCSRLHVLAKVLTSSQRPYGQVQCCYLSSFLALL